MCKHSYLSRSLCIESIDEHPSAFCIYTKSIRNMYTKRIRERVVTVLNNAEATHTHAYPQTKHSHVGSFFTSLWCFCYCSRSRLFIKCTSSSFSLSLPRSRSSFCSHSLSLSFFFFVPFRFSAIHSMRWMVGP